MSIDVDIDIAWPWQKRYRRAWKPRYRYRQIVNVNATWARRRHSARIDVRTQYHHRVLRAGPRRAEVVITIDAIELYAGGRYLGVVDRIPGHLRRVKATIYRDGLTRFDRDLFVVGTPHLGFELIATRSYDRPLLGAYHRGAHRYDDDYDNYDDWDDRRYEREYGQDDFDDERYFGPSSDDNDRPILRGLDPLQRSYDDTVRLPNGGQVTMAREVHLKRIQ